MSLGSAAIARGDRGRTRVRYADEGKRLPLFKVGSQLSIRLSEIDVTLRASTSEAARAPPIQRRGGARSNFSV